MLREFLGRVSLLKTLYDIIQRGRNVVVVEGPPQDVLAIIGWEYDRGLSPFPSISVEIIGADGKTYSIPIDAMVYGASGPRQTTSMFGMRQMKHPEGLTVVLSVPKELGGTGRIAPHFMHRVLRGENIAIVTRSKFAVPQDLLPYVGSIEVPLPTPEELEETVVADVPPETRRRAALALVGIGLVAADRIKGEVDAISDVIDDVPRELARRRDDVLQAWNIRSLRPIPPEHVGGRYELKEELRAAAAMFMRGERDVSRVLLYGPAGIGKRTLARYAAGFFPLTLRLEMSTVLSKWVGESEAKLRQALAVAEQCAPAALYISQLEAALRPTGGGGGLEAIQRNLMMILYDWLTENRDVFVIADAVVPTKLDQRVLDSFDKIYPVRPIPLRRSRDEFVDILSAIMRKHGVDTVSAEEVVEGCADAGLDKYTRPGELEAVVRQAKVLASIEGSDVALDHFLQAVQQIPPFPLDRETEESAKLMASFYR